MSENDIRIGAASSTSGDAESSSTWSDEASDNDAQDDGSNAPFDGSEDNGDKNDRRTLNNQQISLVPSDQERQILILMLLAQVCALHDPTPRTFTVHVLELFERGILDRESINFLYDLGLVPMAVSQQLQTSLTNKASSFASPTGEYCHADTNHNNDELALLRGREDFKGFCRQRSMEVSEIRTRLERQERHYATKVTNNISNPFNINSKSSPPSSIDIQTVRPWSVDEHPLSLSRYQREFEQVCLLNSGAFGHVYKAINHMDGKTYAVKRVTFSAEGFSRESVQTVVREVHCLAVCDHPNVVRYYTSWLEPSWMTGGNGFTVSSEKLVNNESSKHRFVGMKLLQNVIKGEANSERWSDNLKAYFKDPFLSSSRQSLYSGEAFDASEDNGFLTYSEDASDWTIHNTNRHTCHVDHFSSRDDIFFEDSLAEQRRTSNRNHSNQDTMVQDDIMICQQQQNSVHNSSRGFLHQQREKFKTNANYRYQICLFIQMQLCHPSTLADWIRERNLRQPFSVNQHIHAAQKIFHQIACGISHVHRKGIVHRDLKPANIFASTDDGLQFKIGDFGLSKLIRSASHCHDHSNAEAFVHSSHWHRNSEQYLMLRSIRDKVKGNEHDDCTSPQARWKDPLTAGVGTASYAAPEQVDSSLYGTEADIFSLGLILLELLCCFSTEHERLQTFSDCRYQRILPDTLSSYSVARQTILACTEPKPESRPSAADLETLDLSADSPVVSGSSGERRYAAHLFLENDSASEDNVLNNNVEFTDGKNKDQKQLQEETEVEKIKKELEQKDRIIFELRRELEDIRRQNEILSYRTMNIDYSDCRADAGASSSSCSSSEDGI